MDNVSSPELKNKKLRKLANVSFKIKIKIAPYSNFKIGFTQKQTGM